MRDSFNPARRLDAPGVSMYCALRLWESERGEGPMLDCEQFQEVIVDLDRPGVLTAELQEGAFAHAKACQECEQLLAETESLDAGLRRLAARDGDSQAPTKIEAQLLAAFRERRAEGARVAKWHYSAAAGIAAVLLLAVGFWLSREAGRAGHLQNVQNGRNGRNAKPLVAERPTEEAGSARATAVATRSGAEVAGEGSGAAERGKSDAQEAGRQDADSSADAEFIPLPDSDPAPIEDGAVVRVLMPRAALASFGLPVEAMEGAGTVRADLIVSADGTPQAIRLISQDASGSAQ